MSEHDGVIANGTGSAVRTDLNNALAAIFSNNSKSGALTTNYAYQWHVDTSNGNLYIRNAANNGYVLVGPVATTNFGLAPLAGATFTGKVTHNYTSSLNIPSGTTAQRDGSPAVGMLRHNSTLNQFEGYNNGDWDVIGGDNSTTSTIADESSDTSCFPLFATAATGDLGLKSGSNLTFNSSNGTLAATTFSGSGASLTNLPSSALTGALPAIDGSALTGMSAGFTPQADAWRITTSFTGDQNPHVNYERQDAAYEGNLGAALLTYSSGIFTFTSTGWYHVQIFYFSYTGDGTSQDYNEMLGYLSTDSGSNYTRIVDSMQYNPSSGTNYLKTSGATLFKVTNTSTHRWKTATDAQASQSNTYGGTDIMRTGFILIRLGDI